MQWLPPLRVVQVSFHADAQRRDAQSLLRAWPTLASVASAVRTAGVDVTVVQTAHAREVIELDGVTFHFVEQSDHGSTEVIRCIAPLVPDVIHVNGLLFPRAIAKLVRAMPAVPVLVQNHGSVVPTGLRATAWRLALRGIGGVSFTAREQADPWKSSRILRRDLPVFKVLEGSTRFVPGDRDAAREATRMHGDPCFLWTGRLDANKDPLTMLTAFEQAAPKLADARLYCCYGDAPQYDAVSERIASSGLLRERVRLIGTRPHRELELRFRAADFFVQMSHREGSGYSVIEALACGTTPLVSDIAAARAIVGAAGSLTPVGDAEALASAMVEWSLRDRNALRAAARQRFDDALTLDVIGRQLRGAYEALRSSRALRPLAVRNHPSDHIEGPASLVQAPP